MIDTESRRLPLSLSRGVDDSPYRWYAESTTPRYHRYGESLSKYLLKTSPNQWCGESLTLRIDDTESRRLPVSLSRRVDDSAYRWYGESLFENKNILASIFSTLNGQSMPLKDPFGLKLARDVIYYQNWII